MGKIIWTVISLSLAVNCFGASFGKIASTQSVLLFSDSTQSSSSSVENRRWQPVLPISKTGYSVDKIAMDTFEQEVYLSIKISVNGNLIPPIYSIYYAPASWNIPSYAASAHTHINIDPIETYASLVGALDRTPQGLDALMTSGTSFENRISLKVQDSFNWDIAVIDKNQIAICQQNADDLVVTVWLYSTNSNLAPIIPCNELKPFRLGTNWYCYSTNALKTADNFSMLFSNGHLWLLNGNSIALLTPDVTSDKQPIFGNVLEISERTVQNFLGTPKDLNWLPISDSKTSDTIFWNKAAGEFSLMNESNELVTVNLSKGTPQVRKESGESSRSLLLKEVATKEHLHNEAKNDVER